VMMMHLNDRPDFQGASSALPCWIIQSMAGTAVDRYQTAVEMASLRRSRRRWTA
jgi:hypothetical protein